MGRKGSRHQNRSNDKPYLVIFDRIKQRPNFLDGLAKAGLQITGAVAMDNDFSEKNQKLEILFATGKHGKQVIKALAISPRLAIPGKRWIIRGAEWQSYDKDPYKRDPKVPVPTVRKIRSSMMIAHGLKPEFEEDAEDIQVPIEDNSADIDSKIRALCLEKLPKGCTEDLLEKDAEGREIIPLRFAQFTKHRRNQQIRPFFIPRPAFALHLKRIWDNPEVFAKIKKAIDGSLDRIPAMTWTPKDWLGKKNGETFDCHLVKVGHCRIGIDSGIGFFTKGRRSPERLIRPVVGLTLFQARLISNHDDRIFSCACYVQGMEASHLCHNPSCINMQHISLEPRPDNLRRNRCAQDGECTCGLSPPCKIGQKMTKAAEKEAQDKKLISSRQARKPSGLSPEESDHPSDL